MVPSLQGEEREEQHQQNLPAATETSPQQQQERQRPDRSPNSRELIIHPQFKHGRRHPIYSLLSKQHQTWRTIPITGFQFPFIIHQNFVESHENLGSVVWSAGIAAAAYIRQYATQTLKLNDTNWGSVTCLEVGCGSAALVSQCAALSGIKTVMTDLPCVLEWARRNVRHNFPNQWKAHPQLEISLQESKAGSISPLLFAQRLRWGEPSDLPLVTEEYYDIVVAADCLYATQDDPNLQDKLLFTLKNLMANSRTKLLLSYQLRTGREREFVNDILPSALDGDYVVKEIHDCPASEKVHSLVWVVPKDFSTTSSD